MKVKRCLNSLSKKEVERLDQELKRAVIAVNDVMISVVFHIGYNYNGDRDKVMRDINEALAIMNQDFSRKGSNYNLGIQIYDSKKIPQPTNQKLEPILPVIGDRSEQRKIKKANKKNTKINKERAKTNENQQQTYAKMVKDYDQNLQTYSKFMSRSGDSRIQFRLDQIVYKQLPTITLESLDLLDKQIKIPESGGSRPIDPVYKLNIWVVNMNNNLLGYAQFPWNTRAETDGIVINSKVFGSNTVYPSYNLGKTLTHEVGHWLGLYHTFQKTYLGQIGVIDTNNNQVLSGGEKTGDLVQDTDFYNNPTNGNPFNTPAIWPKSDKALHQYMNFMDYTDDICMCQYTNEQIRKMHYFLTVYRNNGIVPVVL